MKIELDMDLFVVIFVIDFLIQLFFVVVDDKVLDHSMKMLILKNKQINEYSKSIIYIYIYISLLNNLTDEFDSEVFIIWEGIIVVSNK